MYDAFLTPDYTLMLASMVERGNLHVMDRAAHHLQEERPTEYHAGRLRVPRRARGGRSRMSKRIAVVLAGIAVVVARRPLGRWATRLTGTWIGSQRQ